MRYQFFTDEQIFTYVNLDENTAEAEEAQLTAQGFRQSGDIIEARSAAQALTQHKEILAGSATVARLIGHRATKISAS